MSPCKNKYCRDGVCSGPRQQRPHACRECAAREEACRALGVIRSVAHSLPTAGLPTAGPS